MSELLQDYEQPVKRPTFITVLCILTFIGSGWGLIGGAIQYFTAEKQATSMVIQQKTINEDLKNNGKENGATNMAKKMVNSMSTAFTAENLKKSGISAMLSSLFCIVGAFMMWKLNRIGFYIYIFGTLIGVISPFIIYGNNNIMSILSSVVVGFVGVIFVILYGVNLKYMK